MAPPPAYPTLACPVLRAGRRKENSVAEFTGFRELAPKWTLSNATPSRRYWARYFVPQFSDRIIQLSREYGIPEK